MKGKRLFAGVVCLVALGGAHASNQDPWEGFNRKVFRFNETVDEWVAKPVAKAYRRVTPKFIDDGVTHFFSNAGEPLVVLNDVLQGKWRQAGADSSRFLINTTIGMVGFVDVATHMDLAKHEEDFGQTLAVWGSGQGPYLMLPFYGPSTVRDAAGRVVQWPLNSRQLIQDDTTRWAALGLEAVDIRADLLDAEKILEGDRYLLIRELYLQRRDFLIHDGKIQKDEFLDSLDNDAADSTPVAGSADDPANTGEVAPTAGPTPPVEPPKPSSPDTPADIGG